MKRILIALMAIFLGCDTMSAQRFTDNLDRGLVAVDKSGSVFLSWRKLADEYYGVTYNVYNGSTKLNSTPLEVTNFTYNGAASGSYTVKAVVNGEEELTGTTVSLASDLNRWVFSQKGNPVDAYQSGRLDITLFPVYDRTGADVTDHYSPNDAEFADLDGDGQLEMIIKRLNTVDAGNLFSVSNTTEFDVIEAYDINWQTGAATRLWWIDVGPNMVSGGSHELNIIAYDWDEDGMAEAVLRGADGMIIHYNDGAQTIGNSSVNTRNTVSHTANMTYTNTGNEFLIYMNGKTGKPYSVIDYPLKRLEANETNLKTAWGDDYGHRSSKYFFGAPVLDGRKASLFLGRGIYTRHKMMAMDLNRNTHTWSTRWTWNCNNSSSPWYGNGFHNYIIADVDEDGRDEIVYGSMVIDDNGKGLSTTGYGHGDAQHVSDFDPWRKGLEYFGCLEENPYWGNNYRNATTSEVLYKYSSKPTATEMANDSKAGDDGRCMMANISNNYPGSLGRSNKSPVFSSVTCSEMSDLSNIFHFKTTNVSLNFRIYWDGDLLSELLDSPGTEGSPMIFKPGGSRYLTGIEGNMNNGSKNNPCFQGDLMGDWREEIVVRNRFNGVSIYTTIIPSDHGLYSLWFDHQYRQAMVWQMHAYNQPPHLSYFLGELEGYTQAPPPLTMEERIEIANGGTMNSTYNGQQVIACETNDMRIEVENGVYPAVFIDNAPSWVQGTDENGTTGTKVKNVWNGTVGDGSVGVTNLPSIIRTYYTHTLTGGAFTGAMHLVKQGDGVLVLPDDVTEAHTGRTDIWAGTVNFNGTFGSSPVWMNRFTTFNTSGGRFYGGLTMEYEARLNVGGATAGTISSVTVSNLKLNYGARVVLDVESMSDAALNDQLNVTGNLTIDKKTWNNGPQYSAPVFEFNAISSLAKGRYPIGKVEGSLTGSLTDVVVEGDNVPSDSYLELDNVTKVLYLVVLNELPTLELPTFAITDMTSTDGGYYYFPTVSITDSNTGVTTSLSGSFTDLAGNMSSLSGTIYSENYESANDISGWTGTDVTANSSLVTGDVSYGQYFQYVPSNNKTRYAYTDLSSYVDVSSCDQYIIEFDLALTKSTVHNSNPEPVEFCVMSMGGTNPYYAWDNYASINSNANMLFDVTGGANNESYTVNGISSSNVELTSGQWYHYTLTINQTARTVAWAIDNVSNGTFSLPDGTSTIFKGFYLVAARYNSAIKLDNINIYSMLTDSYTFTEPGTLEVMLSADGYSNAIASYTVEKPYAIYYESPDYTSIQASEANSVLSNKYSSETDNERSAGWNRDITYTSSQSSIDAGYIDNDSVLTATGVDNSNYRLRLIQGYGIGRRYANKTYSIYADGLGDDNTIVYHKVYTGFGNSNTYDEGYSKADNGHYAYTFDNSQTFCKLIAYVPIDEEYDEMATSAPTGKGDGNVAMKRSFSGIINDYSGQNQVKAWNTLVLPFNMTDRQILTTFGPGTQVAFFKSKEDTESMLKFHVYDPNEGRSISANVPVLIRVGKPSKGFYVFEGVNWNVDIPTQEGNVFNFVGSYVYSDAGLPTNSYFYNASTAGKDMLYQAAEGNTITFKGYRAYFQAKSSDLAKQISLSFEDADALGIEVVELQQEQPVDVYTVSGQLIRRNATDLKDLPRGIYIVGQKKMFK